MFVKVYMSFYYKAIKRYLCSKNADAEYCAFEYN